MKAIGSYGGVSTKSPSEETKSDIPVAEGVAVPVPGQETPLVPSSAGAGEWRTGLCGCFEDCAICCSVCCCHPITVGQLYERTVQKALIKKLPLLSCLSIALLIFSFDIGQQMIIRITASAGPFDQLATVINATVYGAAGMAEAAPPPETNAGPSPLAMVGEILGLLSFALVFGVVYTVRSAIRRREGIKPKCCTEVPQCEDACCAWCCNPCTQCMILRHEKMAICVGNNAYSLCSQTAFPV
jgi:Cys-rich protein (TIGR01571 family)